MRKTKDQKDLQAIIALMKETSDTAYDLFSRRLDTRRNVDSFFMLIDAIKFLDEACKVVREAESIATETKATNQVGVLNEIMIRTGRATIVEEAAESEKDQEPRVVLPFPTKSR